MSRRRRTSLTVKIRQPKRGPNEQPWKAAHRYDCTRGHRIEADQPIAACPAYHHGQACDGTLKAETRKSSAA